jgi:hypothetical protein
VDTGFLLANKRKAFARRSCSNRKLEQDDDSKKSHPALVSCTAVVRRGGLQMQFTVGFKLNGKTDHVVADAQDALDAALKVKTEHPEAVIMYVRPQNRRGDTRHPSHALIEDTR